MNTVVEHCLLMNLLIGSIFFISGLISHFFPPKKINQWYGYRTTRSMKNQHNWDLAQRFSTHKMIQGSLVLILISFFKIVITTTETTEVWIGVLSSIGVVAYVLLSTENELKKKETPCQ